MTHANVEDAHSSSGGPTEMGGSKAQKSNTNASMLRNALKKMEKDKVMNDLKNNTNKVSSKITKKVIMKE